MLLVVHSRIRAKRPLLVARADDHARRDGAEPASSAASCSRAGILPLISLLAVAFGGYIAAYEWRLFQHFQRAADAA